MDLFDDPIRFRERRERADGTTFVLNRQCGLCDHACIESEWLCSCCQKVDPPRPCIGEDEQLLSRPLLPPHWPEHARVVLTTTITIRAPAAGSATTKP